MKRQRILTGLRGEANNLYAAGFTRSKGPSFGFSTGFARV